MLLEDIETLLKSPNFTEDLKKRLQYDDPTYKHYIDLQIALYDFCEENDIDYVKLTEEQSNKYLGNDLKKNNAISYSQDDYGKYLLYVITKIGKEDIQYVLQAAFHELIHIFCHFETSMFYRGELTKDEREKQAQFGSYSLCIMFDLNRYEDFSIEYMKHFNMTDEDVKRLSIELVECLKYIYQGIKHNINKELK